MIVKSRSRATVAPFTVEPLEARRLLHNVLLSEMPNQVLELGSTDTINPAQFIDYEEINGTFLKMSTNFGPIYIQTLDGQAPNTVENFLSYVNAGDYDNSIFHRLARNFVLQTGVVKVVDPAAQPIEIESIQSRGAIQNEYDPTRSNLERTLAMAKIGGDPDSATSSFFFNLGDNSANLDNQNGGFTVFGRVYDDASWDVVQTMNTLNIPGTSTDFPELPEDANGNLAIITDLSVLPENTFTVTSSNPRVVNASIVNGQVSLQSLGAGVATITVTGTAAYDGDVLSDTFNVAVNPVPAVADSDPAPVIITVGNSDSKQVRYTDADGTFVTITSKAALSTVEFIGTDLTFDTSRGVTTVGGTNVTVREIAVSESTIRSSLTITGRGGDGLYTIGDITSAGSVGTITARGGVITGDIDLAGSLAKLTAQAISGGSVAADGAERPVTIVVVGDITGDITLPNATLATLKATSYTSGTVSAANANAIVTTGNFGANVNVSGNLRAATVRGNVGSQTFNVGGTLTKLTVGSWDNAGGNGAITAGAIGTLVSSANFGADMTTTGGNILNTVVRGAVTAGTWDIAAGTRPAKVTATDTNAGWIGVFAGPVSTISVKGTLDGTLSASSITTLAAGTLTAPVSVTDPNLAYSLTTLKVGTMVDAEVRSAGSIRTVVVSRGTLRSGIYAGLAAGEVSADELADFTNPAARIVTAKFSAPRGQAAFSDSAVIAPALGTVVLGAVADSAATIPFFGTSSDTLGSMTFSIDGKNVRVRNPADQASVGGQLQSQGITLSTMNVVIL